MTKLIDWPDLPTWVPGRVLLGSDGLDWRHVALRSYHYEGQDVVVPAMRDFMLVSYGREPATPGALTPARARRIRDFIDAHLAERMDLPLLAAAVDMTPCLFARQFRRTFGQPPYAYVMAQRIERAEKLLAQTAMPIKQIAGVCGFSDQAHMTRLFRRAHGAPPGDYRKGRR